jgi:hypothetical protein
VHRKWKLSRTAGQGNWVKKSVTKG